MNDESYESMIKLKNKFIMELLGYMQEQEVPSYVGAGTLTMMVIDLIIVVIEMTEKPKEEKFKLLEDFFTHIRAHYKEIMPSIEGKRTMKNVLDELMKQMRGKDDRV